MPQTPMEEKSSYNTFTYPDTESLSTPPNSNMPSPNNTNKILTWTRQHKAWTCGIIALLCILLYQFWKRVVMKNIIIDRIEYDPRHYPLPPRGGDGRKGGKL